MLKKCQNRNSKWRKWFSIGPQNVCRQCAESIRGLIKLHELSRPKKLLVFINPQSGSKTGEKIYRRKVAPLFSLCEIQTKVIVTQTENHSKDVLRETDLSDYDGIVCVGGDGTLSEIANGYLQRCYRDGHIDWDNPETVLPRPRLPIGVIPTGSGDTIVRFMNETRSVTTATIHIILGRTRGIDFGSVHNRHKLLSYTCLLIGYGLYGRLIEAIEIRRWLPGRIRYSVIPMIELLNVRSFDVKVQMLKPVIEKESQEGNTSHGNRDPEKTRIQPDTKWEWSNQYEGPLLGVDSFIVHLMPVGNSMRPYMGNGLAQVTLVKNCSRISHLSHLIKLMDRSPGFYDYDFIEEHNVKGYRVEAFPKSQGRRIPEMYLMNCDGDLIKLEEPCFEVRVHKELIKLFTWIDEDWPEWVETKSETLSR
ncbi:ceramide kinase-like [Liolophura sinensis]|uniref:ceramide kinase-like n=1 Tax=Liolophura sinensis TaxID=3198878 RepID=UPI00315908C3